MASDALIPIFFIQCYGEGRSLVIYMPVVINNPDPYCSYDFSFAIGNQTRVTLFCSKMLDIDFQFRQIYYVP